MNEMARTQQMTVGRRPAAIVPQTMDEAYRLGKAICLAGMAPYNMDTPEKCMIAIMRGMEVGLSPMQALDKIAIVNGRPTIWGDGALGLVRGSGLCEWVEETLDGAGDERTATCRIKRRGDPQEIVRTFSVADAKLAKLWNKRGSKGQDTPWITMPERMLRMRARGFALRDGFADVLGGLYLKEELDNEPAEASQPRRIAPSPSITMSSVEDDSSEASKPPESSPKERRAPSPARVQTPEANAGGYDPEKVRKSFDKLASAAVNRDQLNDAWERHVGPHWDTEALPEGHPDRSDLDRLYRQHAARVDGEEGAEP